MRLGALALVEIIVCIVVHCTVMQTNPRILALSLHTIRREGGVVLNVDHGGLHVLGRPRIFRNLLRPPNWTTCVNFHCRRKHN